MIYRPLNRAVEKNTHRSRQQNERSDHVQRQMAQMA